MKKLFAFLLAIGIAVVLIIWSVSTNGGEQGDSGSVGAPAIFADGGIVPQTQGDAAQQTPRPAVVHSDLDTLSDGAMNKLEKECKEAMLCCKSTYEALDKGSSSNVVLSESSMRAMVQALADNGYSAIDFFGDLDMRNPQPLMDFGSAVSYNQDAEAVYYVVHTDGCMHANVLRYSMGKGSVITVSMEWTDDLKPRVYATGQYSLSDVRYTDKGWLIYSRDEVTTAVDRENQLSNYTMLRLIPYDNTRRSLSQKYLDRLAYAENNMFLCSWSRADYGELDFNALFPVLYGMYYGTDTLVHNTASSVAGFKSIPGTGMHIVPYEQFEQVVGQFFDVTPERLRRISQNSSKYGGYFILGAQEKYYGVTLRTPTPDVVDYWYNNDGSLTMKVDAVFPWYGTDRAFTHEVTVMETKDGFYYLSNNLYPSDSNILPNCVLKKAREAEIAELTGEFSQ